MLAPRYLKLQFATSSFLSFAFHRRQLQGSMEQAFCHAIYFKSEGCEDFVKQCSGGLNSFVGVCLQDCVSSAKPVQISWRDFLSTSRSRQTGPYCPALQGLYSTTSQNPCTSYTKQDSPCLTRCSSHKYLQ